MRPARTEEAELLYGIDRQTSANPIASARYQRACDVASDMAERALVVVEGRDVAGYVLLSRALDEVTVLNIAVTPVCQGRGLGRLLLSAALRVAGEDGARRCLLEVRASNRAAIALYRRCGFTEDGVRKGYYPGESRREDALLMSKEL